MKDANCNETKQRKKKKKRKKPEIIKNQQQYDIECDKEVDEIERSIWEVHQLYSEPMPGCSNQDVKSKQVDKKSKEDVLTVQRKHLNPYNEMKKIFGSKTVQTDRKHNRYILILCITSVYIRFIIMLLIYIQYLYSNNVIYLWSFY